MARDHIVPIGESRHFQGARYFDRRLRVNELTGAVLWEELGDLEDDQVYSNDGGYLYSGYPSYYPMVFPVSPMPFVLFYWPVVPVLPFYPIQAAEHQAAAANEEPEEAHGIPQEPPVLLEPVTGRSIIELMGTFHSDTLEVFHTKFVSLLNQIDSPEISDRQKETYRKLLKTIFSGSIHNVEYIQNSLRRLFWREGDEYSRQQDSASSILDKIGDLGRLLNASHRAFFSDSELDELNLVMCQLRANLQFNAFLYNRDKAHDKEQADRCLVEALKQNEEAQKRISRNPPNTLDVIHRKAHLLQQHASMCCCRANNEDLRSVDISSWPQVLDSLLKEGELVMEFARSTGRYPAKLAAAQVFSRIASVHHRRIKHLGEQRNLAQRGIDIDTIREGNKISLLKALELVTEVLFNKPGHHLALRIVTQTCWKLSHSYERDDPVLSKSYSVRAIRHAKAYMDACLDPHNPLPSRYPPHFHLEMLEEYSNALHQEATRDEEHRLVVLREWLRFHDSMDEDLQKDPNIREKLPKYTYRLAEEYRKRSKHKEALEMYNRWYQAEPNPSGSYLSYYGELLRKEGRNQEAVQILLPVIQDQDRFEKLGNRYQMTVLQTVREAACACAKMLRESEELDKMKAMQDWKIAAQTAYREVGVKKQSKPHKPKDTAYAALTCLGTVRDLMRYAEQHQLPLEENWLGFCVEQCEYLAEEYRLIQSRTHPYYYLLLTETLVRRLNVQENSLPQEKQVELVIKAQECVKQLLPKYPERPYLESEILKHQSRVAPMVMVQFINFPPLGSDDQHKQLATIRRLMEGIRNPELLKMYDQCRDHLRKLANDRKRRAETPLEEEHEDKKPRFPEGAASAAAQQDHRYGRSDAKGYTGCSRERGYQHDRGRKRAYEQDHRYGRSDAKGYTGGSRERGDQYDSRDDQPDAKRHKRDERHKRHKREDGLNRQRVETNVQHASYRPFDRQHASGQGKA